MGARYRIVVAATALLGSQWACEGATAPVQPLSSREMNLVRFGSIHPLDDKFNSVAAIVNGFGGYYLDKGVPTVLLQKLSDSTLAIAALVREFGQLPGRPTANPRILPCKFDYRVLTAWRDILLAHAEEAGLHSLDVDERANRIGVGVPTSSSAASVQALISRYQIAEEAVVISVSPPAVMTQSYLTSQLRPVPAGASEIHQTSIYYNGCTHGPNVTALGYTGSYFLVNSHCTKYWAQNDTTLYYQPLLGSIYYEGYEVLDPATLPGSYCGSTVRCRAADVAMIKADPDSTVGLYTVARTMFNTVGPTQTSGSIQIDATKPKWTFTGYDQFDLDLVVGYTVNKVGVSTGLNRPGFIGDSVS